MDINYKKYHRDQDYRKFEETFKNIFQKRFNILKRYLTAQKGKVLDIGASTGVFLDIFKGWKTWGVEPSTSAEIAIGKGHKIIKDYFEGSAVPEEYFDVVIMNHTLEHVDNPGKVLRKIFKVLKKGGLILIDVPNFGSLSSKLLGKNWPYLLPDEHRSQFTKKSLRNLLTKNGFKILHWESRSGIFEYANPIFELKRKRFLIDLLLSPYSTLATVLNMGDSMTFIAKKE